MSKTERLDARNPADIARAARLLREGGTVAFPTETVYGLGANALDAAAVERIFVAKQRPHWDPLIVHIADFAMLARVAEAPSSVAALLMVHFWPGPLTLLLPRVAAVPDAVTAGRPLVGVRMPRHPVAIELIRQAGVPIAAPSANTFGHTSPTTAAHVLDDLDGRIDAVLNGGACWVGLESTVLGIEDDALTIYRPGHVSLADLDALVGVPAAQLYSQPFSAGLAESLPSPGVGLRHYAPKARLILVEPEGQLDHSLLAAFDHLRNEDGPIGVMLPDGWKAAFSNDVYRWGAWSEADVLARRLFAGLRALDDRGMKTIVCPMPRSGRIGDAIRNRLEKAAMHS